MTVSAEAAVGTCVISVMTSPEHVISASLDILWKMMAKHVLRVQQVALSASDAMSVSSVTPLNTYESHQ